MVGCAKHDLSAGLWTLWSPFMIKTHDDRVDQVYIDHSESAFPREDKISTSIFFPKLSQGPDDRAPSLSKSLDPALQKYLSVRES